MNDRAKLGYIKVLSYTLLVLAVLCWLLAPNPWRWVFLVGFFALSCIVDYKFFRCPRCKERIDMKIVGDNDFACKNCGKHI